MGLGPSVRGSGRTGRGRQRVEGGRPTSGRTVRTTTGVEEFKGTGCRSGRGPGPTRGPGTWSVGGLSNGAQVRRRTCTAKTLEGFRV